MIVAVQYGPHNMKPWFQSPGYVDFDAKSLKSYRSKEPRSIWQSISDEKSKDKDFTLYVCPNCFLYTSVASDLTAHKEHCRYRRNPPGKLVYDTPEYTIREIQCGSESDKFYIQCLSLFGRMFLETKSICFAVDNFWIYTLHDKKSGLVAGFFSKEKSSWFNYNLACIVVFPPFQRRGFGQAMIGFSYYLTRRDGTVGSPEQPLSDFGSKSYMVYWCSEICRLVLNTNDRVPRSPSIRDLAKISGIDPVDVVAAFENMKSIRKKDNRTFIDVNELKKYAESHKLPPVFDESFVQS